MATTNITSESETKEWVLACGENEQCQIEVLKNNISFVESELQPPTDPKETLSMYILQNIPRDFQGDGTDKIWVFIDNKDVVRKRPYTPMRLHDANGNQINSEKGTLNTSDYLLLTALGKISGSKVIHKFGKNPSVGTSGFDTIWNGGGEYTGFNATAAETVTIASSDANDALLGTGLRTIRLFGLDANFLEQTEDIELDGINLVTSQLSYKRLDKAKGLTSGGGTYGSNIGDITIAQSITVANVFAVIPIGYGSTMIAAYTIPSGKKGYIMTQSAAIANKQSAAVSVRLKAKVPGTVFTVNGEAALNSQGTGFIERKFNSPGEFPAMTDLFIEAEASSIVAVSAFLDILLVDE